MLKEIKKVIRINDFLKRHLKDFYFLIPIKGGLLFSLMLLLNSCGESKSEKTDGEKLLYADKKNAVDIIVVTKGDFDKETISNGKLKALKKSDLKFIASGPLLQLMATNGQKVQTGQTIAVLDRFEYSQKFEQTETAFSTAIIELEDLMLARGFALKDSIRMSHDAYKMLCIRSGLTVAKGNLKAAAYNLRGTVLIAPFSGKIANLKLNRYERVSSDVFCTLIDDSEFVVEFHLVEAEIRDIKLNDAVSVIPFSSDLQIKGYVSEINPVIDEHGLVLVKARVKNMGNQLMEGMNVKVSVKKQIHNLLVVPKSAIVLRQNQEVLFKYANGKAIWTYVQTDLENGDSFSVRPHLEKGGTLVSGDTIIVSGNLNLAHESAVEIK